MKLTKMVGAALVAVLALSAVAVSAASAAEFKATSSPVNLIAGQDTTHALTMDGSSVTCETATFEENGVAAPSKTVKLTPSYSGCTAFGFVNTKIEMNGCRYEFLEPNSALAGNVRLRCPTQETKVRLFTSVFGSTCEVLIGESGNTNLSKVSYKNEATSPTSVKVTAAITGITAEKTKDTGICPLKGTGVIHSVEYSGTSTVEGLSGIGIAVG